MKHKVLLVLLLGIIISVSASAQKVTMNLKQVKLEKVFSAITQQTGLTVAYSRTIVNPDRIVTVEAKNQELSKVLNDLFLGTNVNYEIGKTKIYLKEKVTDSEQQTSNANKRNISGRVVDEKGEPIIGASVMVQGSSLGTITNVDGRYTLANVPENSTITVSYIGYITVNYAATSRNLSQVVLREDSKTLEEVVVVGYGTQKKVNLTGAVAIVSGDELTTRSAANLSQLLQGSVPNMNVNFSSGRPGQGGNFNIRGVNSISADAAPLTIIDGIEGDINKVNPNDVESISVLKDASAAAVYGARAAYGVILVTTKNGKVGKTNVSYNGRFSFGDTTTSTDFETRGYYSAGINDMFYKTYQGVPYTHYTQEDYHELWIRRNDKVEDPSRPWVVEKNGEYKYYGNFDWYNCLFDNTRPTWEHNLTVSGGTEKVKYMLSGNYYNQKGIIRIDPDRFKKYTFRSKIIANITSWFELSNNTSYYHSEYTYPGLSGVNDVFSRAVRHALASIVPMHPDGTLVYRTGLTDTGEVADGVSAVLLNGGHHNRNREYEFVTTFEAVLKPIKHFEVRANYSWAHYSQQNLNRSVDVLYSRNPGETITMDNGRTKGNYLSETQNNQIRQTFNLYATYDNTFANAHSVKVIVGGNYDYKYFKKLGMKRNGLLSESLDDFNLAKGDDISITGGQEEYAILGFFYRLNYGYKDRYLFEASGRYDGSSRFRRGHRFGFFPSFSAGWRVSEEAFFTQAKNYVSNLKLRLSYGSLGNQKTVGYYDYLQLINTGAVMNYAFGDTTKGDYAYESAPNSTDLTWETVITKNIGLDLGFLNNRLNVSFDAYIRDTKDMLMAGKTLPGVYGASSPRMNVADLRTKGWEASITWGDSFTLASKPFNYRVMAGIGDNTSKVTKYDNPNRTLTDPYEGQQLGEIWGYVVDGYFKTDEEARNYKVDQSFVNQMINASALDNGLHAGDLKFVDLDGNNKIEQTTSANDRKDMKVIGNSLPRYNYNFGISADWYGIDFSVLFQGIGKQNWYPGAETSMFWGPYSRPYASFIPSDFMSQVWSEENTDAYFPRPRGYVVLGSNRELAVVNTKYLQNLAYCRLKNLSIGYTLPEKWLSKIGFEKIRVYFSGENLLTFTKLHSDYIDPEQASASNSWKTSKSDANIYPWAKTYSFGVDITF